MVSDGAAASHSSKARLAHVPICQRSSCRLSWIPLPENLDWLDAPVRSLSASCLPLGVCNITPDSAKEKKIVRSNGRLGFRYATQVEKYPGLVIHGPLQAMLLMRAANLRNSGRRVARFSFRAVRPVFDFDALFLSGRLKDDGGLDLYTSNGDHHICMQADLSWHG